MATTVTRTIKGDGTGDYTSLSAFEALEQRDLVALDEIARAECYAFEDPNKTTFGGWTTDETRRVEVVAIDRHAGVWDDTAYRIVPSSNLFSGMIQYATQAFDIYFEGVQFGWHNWSAGYASTINIMYCNFSTTPFRLTVKTKDCIFRGPGQAGDTSSRGYWLRGRGDDSISQHENLLTYGWGDQAHREEAASTAGLTTGTKFVLRNCTFGDPTSSTGNALAIYAYGGWPSWGIEVQNCRGRSLAVENSYGAPTTYGGNMSADTSAPGADAIHSATFSYTDAANGDFSLAAGDPGIDAGVDLSAFFTTDLAGTTRPQGASWDIGALELAAASGVTLAASGTTGQTGAALLSVAKRLSAAGITPQTGAALLRVLRALAAEGVTSQTGSAALRVEKPLGASGTTPQFGSAGLRVAQAIELSASGITLQFGSASIRVGLDLLNYELWRTGTLLGQFGYEDRYVQKKKMIFQFYREPPVQVGDLIDTGDLISWYVKSVGLKGSRWLVRTTPAVKAEEVTP